VPSATAALNAARSGAGGTGQMALTKPYTFSNKRGTDGRWVGLISLSS